MAKKIFGNPSRVPPLIFLPLVMLMLVVNVWIGMEIYRLSKQRAALKKDYSVVNGITHGLLSVNVWRDQIRRIAEERINGFSLTGTQEEKIESEISRVLESMITRADSITLHGGLMKRLAVRLFVNWNDLRRRVPEFSHMVLGELTRPKTKKAVEKIVGEKLDEIASKTHGNNADTLLVPRLLESYRASGTAQFDSMAVSRMDALQRKTYGNAFAMIASMALFLALWLAASRWPGARRLLFVFSVALALVALITSLVAPMIEIDARIKELDFLLLGEHIQFHDQVLFYQSKSILDVTRILLATGKPDSILVGLLLLTFSVIFPITKLIATNFYLVAGERARNNRVLSFFVFRSGKWSMTDVTVVAVFMAYIGFRGILDNQLRHLNVGTAALTSITTNLTSLQPGFILFLSFVCYGLVLSEILKKTAFEGVEKNY